MKKISLKMDFILEVPDDWEIEDPSDGSQLHIKGDGKYFHPDITWLVLDDPIAKNQVWIEGDGEFINYMLDRVKDSWYDVKFIEKPR